MRHDSTMRLHGKWWQASCRAHVMHMPNCQQEASRTPALTSLVRKVLATEAAFSRAQRITCRAQTHQAAYFSAQTRHAAHDWRQRTLRGAVLSLAGAPLQSAVHCPKGTQPPFDSPASSTAVRAAAQGPDTTSPQPMPARYGRLGSRRTLAGSMMPAAIRSSNLPVAAL